MRERAVEEQCVEAATARGAELLKVRFLGRVGLPDRLLILPARPYACVGFVEFKRPGGRVGRHQAMVHAFLRRLSLPFAVIDNLTDFEEFLDGLARLSDQSGRLDDD